MKNGCHVSKCGEGKTWRRGSIIHLWVKHETANGAGRNKDQIKEAKAKKKIKMKHFIEIEKYLKALNV